MDNSLVAEENNNVSQLPFQIELERAA